MKNVLFPCSVLMYFSMEIFTLPGEMESMFDPQTSTETRILSFRDDNQMLRVYDLFNGKFKYRLTNSAFTTFKEIELIMSDERNFGQVYNRRGVSAVEYGLKLAIRTHLAEAGIKERLSGEISSFLSDSISGRIEHYNPASPFHSDEEGYLSQDSIRLPRSGPKFGVRALRLNNPYAFMTYSWRNDFKEDLAVFHARYYLSDWKFGISEFSIRAPILSGLTTVVGVELLLEPYINNRANGDFDKRSRAFAGFERVFRNGSLLHFGVTDDRNAISVLVAYNIRF